MRASVDPCGDAAMMPAHHRSRVDNCLFDPINHHRVHLQFACYPLEYEIAAGPSTWHDRKLPVRSFHFRALAWPDTRLDHQVLVLAPLAPKGHLRRRDDANNLLACAQLLPHDPCCVVVILKQDVAFHEHTLVFVDRVGDTTKSALLNEPGDFFDGSWGLRIRHAHRCERNGDDEKQAHVASSLNGTRLCVQDAFAMKIAITLAG